MTEAPTVVSFGAVPVRQTRNRTLTIENTTGIAVTISIAASTTGPFRWPAVNRTIANGDKTTLSAQLTGRGLDDDL